MAERLKRLYELESALYADGAPLIITAGHLMEDRLGGSVVVQLDMKSISEKDISSVKVVIEPLDKNGEALGSVEYRYQSLKAARDVPFGKKTVIIMPDKSARAFTVQVLEVGFRDGDKWDGQGCSWTPVKSPRTIREVFDDEELATQFAIRYGNDCSYMPESDRGLWICACGLINRDDESKCHGCRRIFSALSSVNFSSLRNESRQRQETERQIEDEDRAELDQRRKKLIKLSFILVPVLLAALLILATVPRYMAHKKDYAQAVAMLEAGQYDRAQEAFAALGDYADSEEQAKYNVAYEKALYIMDCARNDDVEGLLLLGMKRSELAENETVSVALYNEAAVMFEQLGSYRDSQALRTEALNAVQAYYDSLVKADYEAAKLMLEEKKYLEARDAFTALGDYADSAELAKEALYRRAVSLFELTEKYSLLGVYSDISSETGKSSIFYIEPDAFTELGSNASADIREICRNDGVEIKIEEVPEEGFLPVCSDISRLFEELGDYKDSADYVAKALDAGDYTKPFYEMCANGQLYEAYVWLDSYEGDFEARDQWVAILNTYGPYCGNWELKSGDPTLIPMTLGVQAQCINFSSVVTIKDYVITLCIYVEGNTEYPIEMPLAAEGGKFSLNRDGVNTFIAALSDSGKFNYARYNNYALTAQTNSCQYVRAG